MNKISMALIASLTLGLAPFNPPHLWKQFNNLRYGRDMLLMDWVDIVMHGAPWVFLIVFSIQALREKKSAK